jgi:hypothetical protein
MRIIRGTEWFVPAGAGPLAPTQPDHAGWGGRLLGQPEMTTIRISVISFTL